MRIHIGPTLVALLLHDFQKMESPAAWWFMVLSKYIDSELDYNQ